MVEAKNEEDLRQSHKEWIAERLNKGIPFREDKWTASVAVGGEEFVKKIKDSLGVKVFGREITANGDQHQLRENQQPYMAHFGLEKGLLKQNIGLEWNGYPDF